MKTHTVKSVNSWVDAVFVISVKSFDARIQHVEREMKKHNIVFKFMFLHDAEDIDNSLIEHVFSPSILERNHQSLVLKNIAIWREAAANNYKRILVFEDDVILSSNFISKFHEAMAAATKLCDGWLLFLGGSDVKVPDSFFLETGPLIRLPMSTAEGLVSDLTAIRRRLKWIANNKITLPADQLIQAIDKETGTSHFWLSTAIVKQGSTTGLFDSKLDAHRKKHSRAFTIIRNKLNLYRRQILRRKIVQISKKIKDLLVPKKID
ncbi:MAG: 3-deoxy-D-manno-octulosonic-acid transferase [Solimicrobium sp.]|jgi:glycosyl transferase family 25|nr:3-deoxy-D-manno-octulosonic-acid transferase [Solimicrobium sp.]